MRELWLEMWHDIHPDAKSKFVMKGRSSPSIFCVCYVNFSTPLKLYIEQLSVAL